jgi:cytochrome c-type biogenesis protein CcmH
MRVGAALVSIALALVVAAPAWGERPDEAEVERRTDAIAAALRCPVCQNLSVKDSPSDVAASFDARIRELVREGKSDEEVKDFFVARYGEWILLSPPKHGIGLAVWLAPLLALVAGLALAGVAVARWTRRARTGGAAIAEERLERELGDLDEQLATGELDPGDHGLLRARLLARAAVSAAPPSPRRAPSWRWPAAGLAATVLIAATLVPSLRPRGATDFPTGNDFGQARAESAWLVQWQEAERALEAGRTQEGIRRYRLAVAFAPDFAELRARLGFALARAGRAEEAMAQLRRAVRDEPSLPLARLYLGAVLLRDGQRAAAFAHWRRYLELEPKGEAAALVRRQLDRAAADDP